MDCPLQRFKNGFVDLTVQKLQCEQPLQVWSTSSSELRMFVTKKRSARSSTLQEVLDLTQQCIYGRSFFLFFAEATITSTSYLDMLEQFLQLQLFASYILDLVVFQQDGTLPHFLRNYLNETFPGRWIV